MIIPRKNKDGSRRYLARIERGIDPVSGKRRFHFETFATKAEAQKYERAQKHAVDMGRFIEPSAASLGEYLTAWLAGPARMAVRSETLAGYTRVLNRYVLTSELATVPLVRLTTAVLESFYAKLSDRPLSPRTVRYVHSLLHAALGKATRDRLLPSNPAAGATLPRQVRREMLVLDRVQLARLLASSEATENRWHALWCLLAHGGLRPSEALRLTWRDVEANRNRIVVRGETKTDGSKRTVTLPASTMEALAWHRGRQEAEKIAAGRTYRDRGLVFASQTGGLLDLKNATKRYFKPLLTAYYSLPDVRVYDLRHTHVTHLLAAGSPVHVVSKRVGHASAKMTLDVYGHVLGGQDEDAVEKLEAYWGAAS
jgi:integrase